MSKVSRDRQRSAAVREAEARRLAQWGATGAPQAAGPKSAIATPSDTLRDAGVAIGAAQPIWDPNIPAVRACAPFEAWHYSIEPLTRWPVPRDATFEETFGKGSSLCVGPYDGAWCLEAELVRRLGDAGWNAGWLNPWWIRNRRRRFPEGWVELMWLLDDAKLSLPRRLHRLEAVLTPESVLDHGGAPDIIAAGPDGERWVLLEGKATGASADRIKCSQVEWLQQARRLGLRSDDFAVVSARVVEA
jgi:hypothetical protein